VVDRFGADRAEPALDLLEILEFGWHDCYHDVSPPEGIIDDLLLLSDGQLDGLVKVSRSALNDWRDVQAAASQRRDSSR
jgi:hypothetical protein